MSKKRPDTFFLILSLPFLAITIFLFYLVISEIVYANSTSNWKSIEAKVTKAYKRKVTDKTSSSGRSYSKTKLTFEYRYKVKGKEYKSSRYAFGLSNISETAIDNYKVKDTIQIHYSPKDPSFAVVKKEYRFGFWIGLYILFAISASVLVFLLVRGAFK